jgi:hypothetical protein
MGKIHFYSAENGGFETLTNVKLDGTVGCMSCHLQTYADGTKVDVATYQPGCKDCHDPNKEDKTVSEAQCLQCHGRQKTEIMKMKLPDVHRDKGLTCTDCHTQKEMHGDGTAYRSMFDPGAMEATCESCHAKIEDNLAHKVHEEAVDCKACHTKTVITCYNCHFESEVEGHTKRPFGGLKNYMLLSRREGIEKVHPATMFVLTYQGKSFYTIAPYMAHNVVKEGRTCEECHANEAIQKIQNGEKIKLTTWDAENRKVKVFQGVIPVPPNWKEVFELDYLTYHGDVAGETDPSKWEYLKSETDLSQMLYNQPLTEEQLEKLSTEYSIK